MFDFQSFLLIILSSHISNQIQKCNPYINPLKSLQLYHNQLHMLDKYFDDNPKLKTQLLLFRNMIVLF